MASLYPKKKSPFWFIRYRDPKTGKAKDESTKLRRDNREQTQKARGLRAEWEAKERKVPHVKSGEQWDAWVTAFLKAHYGSVEPSYNRATAVWTALRTYFREHGIPAARVLAREHCINYIAWRVSPQAREAGLRKVIHNTALLELKILSMIMKEAVNRGLAGANPAVQLGIKRAKTKVKPEISDDEVAIVEAALVSPDEQRRKENEAMQIAWKVALLQVVRLKETCVPLANVNLEEQTVTFIVKGGREHTALLHPELIPLFTALKAKGQTHAFTMPKWWAKCWYYFFRRHKLAHISFHCTRVTGVTRLRRQGVDQRIAMEFVGHASVIVHQIYHRARKDEQRAAVNALSRTPSSKTPDSPSATAAHA